MCRLNVRFSNESDVLTTHSLTSHFIGETSEIRSMCFSRPWPFKQKQHMTSDCPQGRQGGMGNGRAAGPRALRLPEVQPLPLPSVVHHGEATLRHHHHPRPSRRRSLRCHSRQSGTGWGGHLLQRFCKLFF